MLHGATSFGRVESRNVFGEGKYPTLKNETGVHTGLYFMNMGGRCGGSGIIVT